MEAYINEDNVAVIGAVAAGVATVIVWAVCRLNSSAAPPAKGKKGKKKKNRSKRRTESPSQTASGEKTSEQTKTAKETKTKPKRRRVKNPEKKLARQQRKALEKRQGVAASMPVEQAVLPEKSSASSAGNTSKPKAKAAPADDGWTTTVRKKKRTTKPRQRVTNPDAEITGTVQIDSRKVASIIGTKAVTLYALQDKTGTKIQIPPRPEGAQSRTTKTVTIKITGPSKGVEDCKHAIKAIVTKGFSPLLDSNMTEGFVQVPAQSLHEVIGKGGQFIKALQVGTGARINIPRVDRGSVQATRPQKVGLVGSREDVKKVKAAIKSLLRYHWSEYTHPGMTYIEMALVGGQLSKLIGVRGQTVKSIQGDTKTKIHTPSRGDINQKVVIVASRPILRWPKRASRSSWRTGTLLKIKAGRTKTTSTTMATTTTSTRRVSISTHPPLCSACLPLRSPRWMLSISVGTLDVHGVYFSTLLT